MGVRELDLVQDYTGHFADMVLGVYYAKARMYDASDRRFMATDPVRGTVIDIETIVQYTYVLNNPIRWVDPDGLQAENADELYNIPKAASNSLSREAANGTFVTFTDSNAYGGDQRWYKNNTYTFIHDGEVKNNTGCGSVAAANIIMYYAQTNYQGIGSGLYAGSSSITAEDFAKFMDVMYTDYVKQSFGLDKGVWEMDALENGVLRYAKEQGYQMEAHTLRKYNPSVSLNPNDLTYLANIPSLSDVVEHIRNGLNVDAPVALLVNYNDYAKSLHSTNTMAETHFVTITGMTEKYLVGFGSEKDGYAIVMCSQLADASLTISTWGTKTTIPSLAELWKSKGKSSDATLFDILASMLFGNNLAAYYVNNISFTYFTISDYTPKTNTTTRTPTGGKGTEVTPESMLTVD